ncbi:hypothetical protein ETB91_11685 [Lacticaseibacillus rhamnosus]|jgi:hypothetical protein|nr:MULTISPECIES: hypothetical protein [Lacticaseibacillus]MBZ3796487.1 hypothetical protein [Lacticaseibacillus paracasei]RXS53334.1 hypothetical protein ETB91_11685 [Lacticaseibacillus rhamnosus]
MEMLETSSITVESSRVNSRHKTFGKAVALTLEAVAITGSISFGSAYAFKTGDKLISMQSTLTANEDSKPDSISMEINSKETGAINMSSGKTAVEQKTDDLEKNVDYLISHIDELHKETMKSLNDLETNLKKDLEDKTEPLATKDSVENTFTTKIIRILCWVIGIGLTISSILVTAAITIIIHLWK